MLRSRWWLPATAATALLAVAWLGQVPVSSPGLTRMVLGTIEETTGMHARARGVHARLWKGIRVDSLALHRDFDSTRASLVFPRVRLAIRVLPAVLGWRKIAGAFQTSSPRAAESASDSPGRTESTSPPPDLRPLVKDAAFDNGTLSITGRGPALRARGLRARCSLGATLPFHARGHAELDGLKWGEEGVAENVRLSFHVDRETLSLSLDRGRLWGGSSQGSAEVRINDVGIDTAWIRIKGLDLGALYAATPGHRGKLLARADFSVELTGCRPLLDSLKGHGEFALSDVTASELPVQKEVVVVMFMPGLSDLKFTEVAGSLRLDSGTVHVDELVGKGHPMSFAAAGWIGFDGRFSQELDAVLDADFSKNLTSLVRRSLEKDDQGRATFSCIVRGPFLHPSVELEERLYGRVISNVFQDMGRGIRKMFGK